MSSYKEEIEFSLSIADRPLPLDEEEAFNVTDQPCLFGDDVIDGLQGPWNIAHNAETILRAPRPKRCDHTFAIAIGGGPSVAQHIPALRELQHKCLMVAAQTSVKGLLEAGIVPHLVTPIERNKYLSKYLPDDCGDITFAGAPLVHSSMMQKFKKHVYCPSGDMVYRWCSLPSDTPAFYGSSTGTTAINIAASLTANKVFLVGHDLAYSDGASHWNKSQAPKIDENEYQYRIKGTNGEWLKSESLWKRLCRQITATTTLHPQIVNVNHHEKVGAFIPGCLSEPLPSAVGLPDFTFACEPASDERLARWKQHAKLFPFHARKLDKFFQSARTLSEQDTDILKAGLGLNAHAFSYFLVSILTSISYEARLGEISHADCLAWLKEATHSVLYNCRPYFDQIAKCANAK